MFALACRDVKMCYRTIQHLCLESIVAMLIEHGASPCIPNRKNQTPLDIAHNSQIYKILSEALVFERALLGRSTSIKVSRTSMSLLYVLFTYAPLFI